MLRPACVRMPRRQRIFVGQAKTDGIQKIGKNVSALKTAFFVGANDHILLTNIRSKPIQLTVVIQRKIIIPSLGNIFGKGHGQLRHALDLLIVEGFDLLILPAEIDNDLQNRSHRRHPARYLFPKAFLVLPPPNLLIGENDVIKARQRLLHDRKPPIPLLGHGTLRIPNRKKMCCLMRCHAAKVKRHLRKCVAVSVQYCLVVRKKILQCGGAGLWRPRVNIYRTQCCFLLLSFAA